MNKSSQDKKRTLKETIVRNKKRIIKAKQQADL